MFWTSNFSFFIKENWICTMIKHHAKNILLARNLPFDSDIKQWCHLLTTPLCCLWAESNNRTRCQFEYDATLVFLFVCLVSFINMHSAVVVP